MKRIARSEKDKSELERISADRVVKEWQQPKNYRECVVRKPWGHEYLIFENQWVAIWALRINGKHSTSMHCHPLKKTSLVLLSGEAFCNTFRHRTYLNALDGLILEKGVFHSTKALSPEGIELIEVETPPNKTDLVRLNDGYGREQHGYEGASEMETSDLRRFNYFYFEEPVDGKTECHFAENYSLSIAAFLDDTHFKEIFVPEVEAIYSVCRGAIRDDRRKVSFEVGDAVSGAMLEDLPSATISEKTVLLKAARKGKL